jgi:hypothetical protein
VSSEAKILHEQSAWATALASGAVTATTSGTTITVTNTSAAPVVVPVSAPVGSNVGGHALGQHYGATTSGWQTVGAGATLTITTVGAAPAITSATTTTGQTGVPLAFTVATTGAPAPALTETGSLPARVTFTNNGDGTATLAGTPATGTGGTYALTLTATNGEGSPATQSFTLSVTAAAAVTSPAATTFTYGQAGTFTVTATGTPTPLVTESGPLPNGVTFSGGVLSGTPSSSGTFPLTFTAHNGIGTDATQSFVLTVSPATPVVVWPTPPSSTYGSGLSLAQLDATASVPGTFTYSPPLGTVLHAGVHTLSLTFVPTDTADYATTTAQTTVTINQATVTVVWGKSKAISYGTLLSGTQLDPTASVPGSFAFTPASGALLSVGAHTLQAVFTPADATDYAPITALHSLTVTTDHTKTTLTFTQPLTVGAESGADFVITVSAPGTVTPSGTVVVKSGSKSLCTATLNAGVGHCTLTANQLAVGSYKVGVTFPGHNGFSPSKSASQMIVISP